MEIMSINGLFSRNLAHLDYLYIIETKCVLIDKGDLVLR